MSRVALVTGGTRGIGAEIAIGLQEAGYTVIANYAGNIEKAKAFVKFINGSVFQDVHLPGVKRIPNGMFFVCVAVPFLLDGKVIRWGLLINDRVKNSHVTSFLERMII